jgi:hypothetical protein
VKAHVAKLLRKVGVQNRIALSVHAITQSLVSPPKPISGYANDQSRSGHQSRLLMKGRCINSYALRNEAQLGVLSSSEERTKLPSSLSGSIIPPHLSSRHSPNNGPQLIRRISCPPF